MIQNVIEMKTNLRETITSDDTIENWEMILYE